MNSAALALSSTQVLIVLVTPAASHTNEAPSLDARLGEISNPAQTND